MREIVAAGSVAQSGDVTGKVLVAGSHGGIVAACLGARAGAHALILEDAVAARIAPGSPAFPGSTASAWRWRPWTA